MHPDWSLSLSSVSLREATCNILLRTLTFPLLCAEVSGVVLSMVIYLLIIVIDGHTARISGGVEIDGSEIGPIVENEVLEQAKIIKEKGLRKVAIVGIYAPFDDRFQQEEQVRNILKKSLDAEVDIICSKDGTSFSTSKLNHCTHEFD